MSSKRSNGPSQVVAVGGGNGEVGAHVIEELLELNKVDVVILLRKSDPELVESLRKRYPSASNRLHAPVVTYDVDFLTKVFEDHNVDTVISCIWPRSALSFLSAQHALLSASIATPSVRRFAPNDWATGITPSSTFRRRSYAPKFEFYEPLNKSELNWHSFSIGIFANYFLLGAPGTQEALGHMRPYSLLFSPDTWEAKVPVDDEGNEQLFSFTRIQDAASMAARSCLLDNLGWSGGSAYCSSFTTTISDGLREVEKASGKQIKITKIRSSDAQKAIDTNDPSLTASEAELLYLMGKYSQAWENDLGAKLGSQGLGIKFDGLEQLLSSVWAPV